MHYMKKIWIVIYCIDLRFSELQHHIRKTSGSSLGVFGSLERYRCICQPGSGSHHCGDCDVAMVVRPAQQVQTWFATA